MLKKTTITFGKIALEAERATLARENSLGGQVLAFEHMVERLAGGFLKIVDILTLRESVARVLPGTDVGELEGIKHLPGMTFACARSLMAWWMSGLRQSDYMASPRMRALFALEAAVEADLPYHMRKPSDIVDLACARVAHAPRIFGRLVFKGMTDLHPVWRPVLFSLREIEGYGFEWAGGPLSRPAWLSEFSEGMIEDTVCVPHEPSLSAETSADARHEVLEALRWAFGLMAKGHRGEDIAIAAVSSGVYQGLVYSEARHCDIEVHLAHGIPALQTTEGQQCAALADVLIRGLSHKRVRRLADVLGTVGAFAGLPGDWTHRIPQDASLLTVERWKMALHRRDMEPFRAVAEKAVDLLALGVGEALAVGHAFLPERALSMWTRALQNGPASALDQTLRGMRTQIDGTALDRVCFMAAADLVAAPRRFVRLLGMTSRAWPRREPDDSLIPDYIAPRRVLSPMSVSDLDRRDFESILRTTENEVVFSWPRADAEGRELRPSTLVPVALAKSAAHLDRARTNEYAISEGDRLFMRSNEFSRLPHAMRAQEASRNWSRPSITEHDGLIAADHPRVEALFGQVQSATSLQKMIRDPLGFVWKYGLGFHAPEYDDEPLLVDARVFGNIVHAILRYAVEKLSRKGGFTKVSRDVLRVEVRKARLETATQMERSKPIPPPLVWTQTLDRAEDTAIRTLLFDYGHGAGDIVSYAEIPFGKPDRDYLREDLPWALDKAVVIPGTGIRIRGSLDRFDLSASTAMKLVVDYKTGKTPKKPSEIGIAGGQELQRGLYTFAVQTLTESEDTSGIVAALYYPLTDTYVPMEDIDTHLGQIVSAVGEAQSVLRKGFALPGIAAPDEYNDMLFAYPARAASIYLENKRAFIGDEFDGLRQVWETK